MSIFVDTSLIYAYLNRHSDSHAEATQAIRHFTARNTRLISSNYVILESNALMQRRLGMKAVRAFEQHFVPLLAVAWVDKVLHEAAMVMLLTANRRGLSLVDCTSFEIMRREGINTVLTLDRDFAAQGFEVLPERGP